MSPGRSELRSDASQGCARCGGRLLHGRLERSGKRRSPTRIGKKARLEALASHVAKASRNTFEAPEFFRHAVADGIWRLFVRHGRRRGLDAHEQDGDFRMEFDLLGG